MRLLCQHQVHVDVKSAACNIVTNVVISRDFSSSSTWWNPHWSSSFENTVQPFRSYRTCSIVGIGCLSLAISAFALRMSTQILISPSAYGTTTRENSVGLSDTFSVISLACISSKFSPTFSIQSEAFSQIVQRVWHYLLRAASKGNLSAFPLLWKCLHTSNGNRPHHPRWSAHILPLP